MVDLSSGCRGVIEFRDGERYFCFGIGPCEGEPGIYAVRIENGVYYGYHQDGRIQDRLVDEAGFNDRDILKFTPTDENVDGLPTQVQP